MRLVQSATLEHLTTLSSRCLAMPPQTFATFARTITSIIGGHVGVWRFATDQWTALDGTLHTVSNLPISLNSVELPPTIEGQAVCWITLAPTVALSLSPAPDFGEAATIWHSLLQAHGQRILAVHSDDPLSASMILQQLPIGVLVAQAPSGRLMMANQAAERLWGHPFIETETIEEYKKYAVYDTANNRIDPEDMSLARTVKTGKPVVNQEVALVHQDGSRIPILANTTPLHNADGSLAGAVVVFNDISSWKRQEYDRDNAIAAIAHDLKNPLTTIRGSAELLLRRAINDDRTERERTRLQTIIDQADRMRDFLGSLVDVARLHSGELPLVRYPLDLRVLLERTISALNSSMAHPRIVATLEKVPFFNADQIWMERVITNLLDNALKYSPQHTTIRVILSGTKHTIVLRIDDQGIGIEPDELERIFDQFARGRNSSHRSHGSGLGLYTVRAVVQAHGGIIRAESEGNNRGSTFIMRLPLEQ